MSTRLNMAFKSADGSTVTYGLDDPREDLTAVQVSTFMQDMIDADAFDVKGGLRERFFPSGAAAEGSSPTEFIKFL